MLPVNGSGLPPWRQKVMPWIMALVRLAAGWVVAQGPLATLLQDGSFMRHLAGAPLRYAVAALYLAGLALFTLPATCLWGFGLLLAGLGAFQWLWARTGQPMGLLPLWTVAILAVLAGGEWLSRRLRTRLYRG